MSCGVLVLIKSTGIGVDEILRPAGLDLCCSSCRRPLERDVTEYLVATDRTLEELEHRPTISLDLFETGQ